MEQEEEITTVDPQYLKGFNYGYLLAGHEPQIAAMITARKNDHNAFFNGLVGGKGEYEKEVREWAKGFSQGKSGKDSKELDKER